MAGDRVVCLFFAMVLWGDGAFQMSGAVILISYQQAEKEREINKGW